ncbi:hypothetical protein D3C80_2235900 [compost metagenome]
MGIVVGPHGFEDVPWIAAGFADVFDRQAVRREFAIESEEGVAVMNVPGVQLAVQETLDFGL